MEVLRTRYGSGFKDLYKATLKFKDGKRGTNPERQIDEEEERIKCHMICEDF